MLGLSLHLIIHLLIPPSIKYILYTCVSMMQIPGEKSGEQIQTYFLSHRVHSVGERSIH